MYILHGWTWIAKFSSQPSILEIGPPSQRRLGRLATPSQLGSQIGFWQQRTCWSEVVGWSLIKGRAKWKLSFSFDNPIARNFPTGTALIREISTSRTLVFYCCNSESRSLCFKKKGLRFYQGVWVYINKPKHISCDFNVPYQGYFGEFIRDSSWSVFKNTSDKGACIFVRTKRAYNRAIFTRTVLLSSVLFACHSSRWQI